MALPPPRSVGDTGHTTDHNDIVAYAASLVSGAHILSGSGAPSGATGVVGDWYLNTANGDWSEKTGASTWTFRFNSVGPAGTGVSPPATITGTVTSTVPLTISGAAGQTAQIFSTQLSDGTVVLAATSGGEVRVGPGTNNTNGTLRIGIVDPARRGINMRLAASQSAPAIRVEDSAGTLLSSIGSDGSITAPNIGAKLLVLNAAASVPAGTAAGTVILRRP